MEQRKNAKNACLALAAVVVAIYACMPVVADWHAVGVYSGCPMVQRLTYNFIHASWWHAIVNVWALLTIVFYYDASLLQLAVAFVIAITVPSVLLSTVPTVGLSAVCYALLGMMSWRVRRKLLYHVWALGFILTGLAFTSVNATLHGYCYACGIIYGLLTMPLCLKK